ncbi:MAG: hypothetical protein WC441_04940 [Patescibacteria group bacterium]
MRYKHKHSGKSGTGLYGYDTPKDGLMEFHTKKAAIKNAARAARREHRSVDVLSPTGFVVATLGTSVEGLIDSFCAQDYTPFEAADILNVAEE